MPRRRAVVLLCALSLRCGAREAPRRDLGPIVARVDGEAIHADEVALVARTENVSPREALERVVRERLIAREALRLGVANDDDVANARWHARVRLLLAREVEARNTPANIPNDFFQEIFDRRRVELTHDGLVEVVHALALADGDAGPAGHEAARAKARRFYDRVLATLGPRPSRERFEALAQEEGGLHVESLPGFDRTGQSENGTQYVTPFAQGAWALTEATPLSAPIDTPFGTHVILRVGAVPPRVVPPDQVRAVIVRDGTTIRRSHALRDLVERLRARADVRVSETALGTPTRAEPVAAAAPTLAP